MAPENVTNEDLLKKLDDLKTQVQLLQEHINNRPIPSSQENNVEFLLAEFSHLSELFRHTDTRLESGFNLYLTGSAVIISGLIYFSQQVTDFQAFLISVMFVAFVLAASGIVLSRRITSTSIIKAGYLKGLNVIRGYFVDNDQSIRNYLVLPISDSTQPLRRELSGGTILIGLQAWSSLLLGFISGVAGFLAQLSFMLNISIGILVAVVCFIVLQRMTKRQIQERTS